MQTQPVWGERDQLSRGLAETTTRLMDEFHERLQPEVIQRIVDDTYNTLKDATVSEFVPLFVYRAAREQLADMTRPSAV